MVDGQVRRSCLQDAAAEARGQAGDRGAHHQEEAPVMGATQHQPQRTRSTQRMSISVFSVISVVAFSALSAVSAFSALSEQRGAPPAPAAAPRAAAPIDLTGYWVSLVTDD